MKPGDQFSIWAHENRTTGFRWIADLDMEGPCKNHLKLVSENYFVRPSDPMMMGVGGTAYKTYELSKDIKEKGECVIPFILNQPWNMAPPGWQQQPDTMIRLKID